MTWYEILESPLPAASSQEPAMAAHIVRWWRTKFRNGYKQFSVLAEGERTDTEELVGRAPSQCSAPPDLLPSGAARALLSPEPTSALTEPAQTQRETPTVTPPTPANADRLHFEEFTCDVQVRGGEAGGGAQPLHFSFTLYDFDGHGRITKDDIAGIVSTIYESVGKTVTVPHYGSKTIQVRLTVSPDQRRAAEEGLSGPNGLNSSSPTRMDQKVRFKRDLSAHVREGRRKPRRRRPEQQISPAALRAVDADKQVETLAAPAEEERRSRLSVDDDVSDCSERLRTPKGFKRNIRQRQYQKNNLSPRYRNQQNNLNCNNTHKNDIWNSQRDNVFSEVQLCASSPEQTGVQSADGGRGRGVPDKKRSGSLQRRELLEIIQANMEKNHLSFQTTRKQYIDQRGVSSLEGDSLNAKHRQRNRSNTFTGKHSSEPIARTVFSDQPNNGYLDLANANINSHKESNLCRYDSLLHAVICSSSQHAKSGYHLKSQQSSAPPQQKPWKSHHRSRSHDLDQGPFRYTLLEPYECITPEVASESLKPLTDTRAKSFDYCREQEVLHRVNVTSEGKVKSNRTELKSKSYDLEHNIEVLRKTNINRKAAVQSHAFSPHHIKHQNREKYHARAMAQVEKWLENDNNTRLTKNPKKKWSYQNCKVSEKVDNLTANLDLNDSVEWKGLLRGSEADAEGAESGGASTVHRYVHEHIHHHYHHFEDKIPTTNAVVV